MSSVTTNQRRFRGRHRAGDGAEQGSGPSRGMVEYRELSHSPDTVWTSMFLAAVAASNPPMHEVVRDGVWGRYFAFAVLLLGNGILRVTLAWMRCSLPKLDFGER